METFLVNGMKYKVPSASLSYEDIVKLAYPGVTWTDMPRTLTIVYERNRGESGSITFGQYLTIQAGTIINVADTSRA